jgi:hypothetical protein
LHVSGGHEKFDYIAGSSWPMIRKVFERPPKPYIETYDKRGPSPPKTNTGYIHKKKSSQMAPDYSR